ncbi:MAG: S41 family peptidase [Deltaproteobacteria bacterium]|nr:S41 family peptidase [Deltaproteobacteria bacterium]
MKNLRLNHKKSDRGWLARRTLLLLLLLVVTVLATRPLLSAETPSSYDSLRLFTEALFEISQKYVYPKSEEDMIYGSLRGMMNSLDPDSSFLTPQEYQSYVSGKDEQAAEAGVEVIIKDNLATLTSVIDGGPAATAGLKPGDHILKLNGQMVRNLTTQEMARRFRGAPGASLKLQIIRNGALKPLDITVTFAPLTENTVTSRGLHDSIGYLRLRYFNDATPKELGLALKSLQSQNPKGLILDLRNNARGSMEQAVRTASLFVGDKDIVAAKGRATGSQETFRGKERDQVMKAPLPIVVLIDQGTARAAEIVAAALHDQYQATLLGAKTLGLCGLTKAMPLQDGSALVMTVAQCYTPSGQKIPGKGLEPQVQGQTPKPKDKAPAVEEPQKAPNPEQDPWVQQAIGILKGGKKA